MKVLVAIEQHFYKTPDGRMWTKSVEEYEFWKRYLEVFSEVDVLARVREIDKIDKNFKQSDGENVSFICLPDYRGAKSYFAKYKNIKKIVIEAVKSCDVAILRVPGNVGTLVEQNIRKFNKLYAVEVVGDPWDSLAPGSVKSLVRPVARVKMLKDLRRQCKNAVAASYVTDYTLQNRYPSNAKFITGISSINLYIENENLYKPKEYFEEVKLINVGSMANNYKGHDVQIKALAELRKMGVNAKLTLVGDGDCRKNFEKLAEGLEVKKYTDFKGIIPNGEILKLLDEHDLFILPSYGEGLPRALIEAMSRGLPCIASRVAGTPELLNENELIAKGDYKALTDKILVFISNGERISEASKRNYEKAKKYDARILSRKRKEFYLFIKNQVLNS